MSRPTFRELHENPKVLIRAISNRLVAAFDDIGYYVDQKLIVCSNRSIIEDFISQSKRPKIPQQKYSSVVSDRFLTCLINSTLLNYFYTKMVKSGISIYFPKMLEIFPSLEY